MASHLTSFFFWLRVMPGKGRKRVHRIIHRTFDENGDRTPYKLYPDQIRERERERETSACPWQYLLDQGTLIRRV